MGRAEGFTGRLEKLNDTEPPAEELRPEESGPETELVESIKQAVYNILAASEVNEKFNIIKSVYYPAILNTPTEARAKWGLRQGEILSGIKVELRDKSLVIDATDAIDLLNNRNNNLAGNLLTQEAGDGEIFDTQVTKLKKDLSEFLKNQYPDIGDRSIEVYV